MDNESSIQEGNRKFRAPQPAAPPRFARSAPPARTAGPWLASAAPDRPPSRHESLSAGRCGDLCRSGRARHDVGQ